MKYKKDSLGTRMKTYEEVSRNFLIKKVPVIIRLDGKSFHTLTRHCDKPFDSRIMDAMSNSVEYLVNNIQGCKVSYTQSDEATLLLTDYEDIKTGCWFEYNVQKLTSIAASMMSVAFNHYYKPDKFQVFDARAFNIPKEDVVNCFLWRAKDWERNSIQMLAQANFSHKELQGLNQEKLHNLLHTIGKNWTTDLTDREKNGRFFIKNPDNKFIIKDDIKPTYLSIEEELRDLIYTT